MTRWIDRPPPWSRTIPTTGPVPEPFLRWLASGQPGPVPVGLPAEWTDVALAAVGRGWATRFRRRDELERYLRQATLDDVPLTQSEHRRLRAVIGAPPASWAPAASVQDIDGVFSACLPAGAGRTDAQAAVAASALTRLFLEFALAHLDGAGFALVAAQRLGRLRSGQPRAADLALTLTQADLIARCWLVGALDPEQFEPGADAVREAAERAGAPTNRGEVVLYLRQLIRALDVDPLRRGPAVRRTAAPHLARTARISGGDQDDGRRLAVDDLVDLVDHGDLLVLFGAPGAGGSWLARRAARRSAENSLTALAFGADVDEVELPVFAAGPQLGGLDAGDCSASAITAAVADFAGTFSVDRAAELRTLLARSGDRRLLVVDSIDQIRRGTLALPVGAKRRTIVTCRPRGWREQLSVDPQAVGQGFAEILPLDDPREVDAFIDLWCRGGPELSSRPSRPIAPSGELRRSPLVLELAVQCATAVESAAAGQGGAAGQPGGAAPDVLAALEPRTLRDRRSAREWASQPVQPIVDRLASRPDADPIWQQAAAIVLAHPDRPRLLAELLAMLDGRRRSPYEPAGPQEDLLVDIASETIEPDWSDTLAQRIHRARIARAAGRDFADLTTSAHWAGSNPEATEVLVDRLEREWRISTCEQLSVTVVALHPSAAQAARIITKLAGWLQHTTRPDDAAAITEALLTVTTSDAGRQQSWAALQQLAASGRPWARVIAETGLIRLAPPAHGWDLAARRLVALPHDRTASWEAGRLVAALVTRARTAQDRARLAASLLTLLVRVPVSAAPSMVAALLRLDPTGDDARPARATILQRITTTTPLTAVDSEALVEALLLLEPDARERAVTRRALLDALHDAAGDLVSRDLGAGLFARYLDALGATEPERDIARNVVLTALEAVTGEGVTAAQHGYRNGPWSSGGRINRLVEALHELGICPDDRRRAQSALALLIDRGALAHGWEKASWLGAMQRLAAPPPDELPDSPPRGASRPPITQPVPIWSPPADPQPSVSMVLPSFPPAGSPSPAEPLPPGTPRPPISEPIPIGPPGPLPPLPGPRPPVPGPQPPQPGPPPGLPERHPVPDAAVFGRPPPPLPSFIVVAPPPISTLPDAVDNVLSVRLSELENWTQRLHAVPAAGWSAVSVLRAAAPSRGIYLPDGRFAILEESDLRLVAMRLPEPALDPRPGIPLLSRLRALHDRLLPGARPLDARWHEIGGVPAVLDTLAGGAAFQLSAELTADDGLVAYGSAPPSRAGTLVEVGLPLAALARPAERGLVWATPPNWVRIEELQLYGPDLNAQVRLEPLGEGADLQSWTDLLFRRAPFLRDYRELGDRAVRVPGCDEARMHRFDWQPSGRARLLTTLVAGIAGRHGFSFVLEVPLQSTNPLVDPDEVLGGVSVDPG